MYFGSKGRDPTEFNQHVLSDNPQAGVRTKALYHEPATLKENCSQLYYSSLAKEIWALSTPVFL